MSAVTDPHAGTCNFGHNLFRDFAVRYGNDRVRHCRMCELQLQKAAVEREITKIEAQGRRSWKS